MSISPNEKQIAEKFMRLSADFSMREIGKPL
jgi:hypothetical protein